MCKYFSSSPSFLVCRLTRQYEPAGSIIFSPFVFMPRGALVLTGACEPDIGQTRSGNQLQTQLQTGQQ